MVLAAGLGTRLRPLTGLIPKPLLPVRGVGSLAATSGRILSIAVHIGPVPGVEVEGLTTVQSEHAFGIDAEGNEQDEAQALKDFLAPAELVLLVNGDSLCEWPFRKLIRKHIASGARSTLLLTARPDPARFGGGVGIDRAGRILSFWSGDLERGEVARRFVFAGAHAFSPDLLAPVGPGKSDIVRDLYIPMLAEGAVIDSVVDGGLWHDMGTPQRFLDGVLDRARADWPERLWRRSWISPEASLEAGAQVRRSAIEPGAKVGEGARIERSVLLPGARIGKGCMVRETIVGFGASVPPGTWVERRIVMPQSPGFAPGLDDSVVGGAVYTPFGPDTEG